MDLLFNPKYPSVNDLRARARKRIPRFAFEYLDGGCNDDVNLRRNTFEIRQVQLDPHYLSVYSCSDMSTELFGHVYDAPFGVAPIGLQGLMWPKAPEILAKAAVDHNIPFILSTVSTSSIETIGEITSGKAWFQLYHPAEDAVRDDLIRRIEAAGYPVLVILCDSPNYGYRPRDIRNGLAVPPQMSFKNVCQMLGKPRWAIETLIAGKPEFKSLTPYIPRGLNLKTTASFMQHLFAGRLSEDKIKPIRDMWKGKLVLKGVMSDEDTERAIALGLDGIIISNHGGRQLDAGQSTIRALPKIAARYQGKIKIMLDSGIRGGPDIARVIASGAEFAFVGRSLMYGVAALGRQGGNHTISILKRQLRQIMEQISCERIDDLPNHLVGGQPPNVGQYHTLNQGQNDD